MGLFGKIFDKKECSVCGGEIGLLGNRKLDDGNLCRECAAKLSPWFSDRRHSTIAEIREQLAYREENKNAVAQFHVTRTIGRGVKLLLDEDNRKFVVTSARNLKDANPDVLDFAQVTGVDFDIDEMRSEDLREDQEGKKVSFNPRRYYYSYDFHVTIYVNHPYFNEMKIRLCDSDVQTGVSVPEARKPNPRQNPEYKELEEMGIEIKEILTGMRKQAREEAQASDAPKQQTVCPACGAVTMPDENNCCEFCGTSLS